MQRSAASTVSDPQGPVMVLVRPQMGENIGASARAMLNFGLERMRVVAPRDGWPNPRAVAMASGAGSVLERAGVFADLPEAVADCDWVLATTALVRGMSKPVLTPERAMQQARALGAAGKRVAVVFGPERAGLGNEDVARANALVTVPANPSFNSLNLAQCVLLMAYEWGRQGSETPPEVELLAGMSLASQVELARLGDHFEARLDAVGYFFPAATAEGMKRSLRNMWSRLRLTRADVQILHGMLRTLGRGGG